MIARRTCIGMLFLFVVSPALGQTAGMLGFQGLIKDDQGVPLDGSITLDFRVFDALVGGLQVDITGDGIPDSPADTIQVVGVSVAAGLFSTKFGPISPATFDGNDRFLEVSVDGDAMSRIEMVTAVAVSERVNKPGTGLAAVSIDASSNVIFSVPTAARGGVTPVLTFNLASGTISSAGSLSFQTGGFARGGGTRMTIDAAGDTSFSGSMTVSGPAGITIGKMILTDSARGGGGVELALNLDGDLELKVDGNIVDRWTGLGNTGKTFGFSPNRISGTAENVVAADTFGAVIGGGGGSITGSGNTVEGDFGTIGGGTSNKASGEASTVAGGTHNTACGFGSFVGGGFDNTASGAFWAMVPGGAGNVASGHSSFAAGEGCLASGDFSFAIGHAANATNAGMFVWADNNPLVFPALTESNFTAAGDQFLARTGGGAVFVTAIDLDTGNSTAGVQLASGGGSWATLSDRNAKENVVPVNSREALEKVAAMPISTWNYKSQDPSIRHIGPMAQDVFGAFGVGEKETMITTIDADGIALAAIQGLHELIQEKDCEIAELDSRNDELEFRNDDLEIRLARLEQIVAQMTTREGGAR